MKSNLCCRCKSDTLSLSQWLKDGFLGYLKSWEDSVMSRNGFEKSEKQKMLLSTQTLEGLKITGMSIGARGVMFNVQLFILLSINQCNPLPPPSLSSLVHAFVEMANYLFCIPGVQYILSEKLCQDPLESFFGKQRAAGGRSDNPTVKQFCLNTVSLRVQGSAALEPIRGNCGKRPASGEISEKDLSEPIPKRPRCSKKLNI